MPAQRYPIDITLPVSERLAVWPGDVPVQIRQTREVATVSELRFSSHAGTHLDAPLHFFPGGTTVDQIPLDLLIGPAWLADMDDAHIVTTERLEQARIPTRVERLLIKTQNSARLSAQMATGDDPVLFDETFIALDRDAAEWLIERNVRLLGIDGPSIDVYGTSDFPAHRALLRAGIIVVENLHLDGVARGSYRLICLPLNYRGGDGAPVRAVLEPIEQP